MSLPPEQPLALQVQDFGREFRDADAPELSANWRVWIWRILTFGPASATTLALIFAFVDWFSVGGLNWLEILLITLVGYLGLGLLEIHGFVDTVSCCDCEAMLELEVDPEPLATMSDHEKED